MTDLMGPLKQYAAEKQATSDAQEAAGILGALIQRDRYIGEVFSVGFREFTIQVHDHYRQRVGGVPQGAFLIATRIPPGVVALDPDDTDSEIVLLRAMRQERLPSDAQRQSQRDGAVIGAMQGDGHWEASIDEHTHNLLSISGLGCRLLGTVYVKASGEGAARRMQMRMGADVENFFSGRGMKVYMPTGEALGTLLNHRDPDFKSDHALADHHVDIAEVRYASTRRATPTGVSVSITPADLIGQKTALFGMTRTGKSNTTKVIARAVYELRALDPLQGRVAQLIFDPQGEYANANVQDGGALVNVHKLLGLPREGEVRTYGTAEHPDDPGRVVMKINAFGDIVRLSDLTAVQSKNPSAAAMDGVSGTLHRSVAQMLVGKEMLGQILDSSKESKYIGNFIATDLTPPDLGAVQPSEAYSAAVRYLRTLLVYRALLAEGGLKPPFKPELRGLFGTKLRAALRKPMGDKADEVVLHGECVAAADILEAASPSWSDVAAAMRALVKFRRTPQYNEFDADYRKEKKAKGDDSGRSWHDDSFDNVLGMFQWPYGPRLVGRLAPNHSPDSSDDYAEAIYKDLLAGRLVIVDGSLGDEGANRAVAERVVARLIRGHMEAFGRGKTPEPVMVYVEEAHNLLPKKNDQTMNVWSRLAKEGAKLNLGFVYATQEVSGIQGSILKNTANFFVAHLNNDEEIREISKYCDFADFAESLRQAPNKGFLRVKTLSNLFTVPVQMRKFEVG